MPWKFLHRGSGVLMWVDEAELLKPLDDSMSMKDDDTDNDRPKRTKKRRRGRRGPVQENRAIGNAEARVWTK